MSRLRIVWGELGEDAGFVCEPSRNDRRYATLEDVADPAAQDALRDVEWQVAAEQLGHLVRGGGECEQQTA